MDRKLVVKQEHIDFLVMILLIIVSDETLWFGTNKDENFITIKYVVLCGLAVFLALKYIILKRGYKTITFAYALGMVALVLVSSVLNNDVRSGVIYKVVLILLACAITIKWDIRTYAYYFDKIIYVIAIISLIGFFLTFVATPLIEVLPRFVNSADTEFYNGFVFMIPTMKSGWRNYSFFREPGVYQMFLIIALVFQLGVLNNASVKKILVYIAAIITTMSTTGYISLLFLVILFVVRRRGNNIGAYKKVFFILILALIVAICIYPEVVLNMVDTVFSKLSNLARLTTIARFGSITENFRIFKENILLGAGLTRLDELFPLYCYEAYGKINTNNTNIIMIQFASHGLFYGLLFCYGLYGFCKKLSKNTIELVLFGLAMVSMYCGENLTFSVLPYIIFCFGVKQTQERDMKA